MIIMIKTKLLINFIILLINISSIYTKIIFMSWLFHVCEHFKIYNTHVFVTYLCLIFVTLSIGRIYIQLNNKYYIKKNITLVMSTLIIGNCNHGIF